MGKGFLGEAAAEIGTGAWFAIGPLAPDRAAAYAGLPFTTVPGAGSDDHAFVVDLGHACDLDRLWKEWEARRPDLFATRWPMIAHMLLHLLPAHLAIGVRLRPAVGAGWILGSSSEPSPALDSAGSTPRPPSTLGAWTALAPAAHRSGPPAR